MNFLPLIASKREGKTLAPEQIQEFIREFAAGTIPACQMAACEMKVNAIVNNSFGFGEHNARIAVKKFVG